MSLKDVMTVASSEYVFAVLFIGFLWIAIKQVQGTMTRERESSNDREKYIFVMHDKQLAELKDNMLHERNNSHEMLIEQRHSFDKRESELVKHLNKNTDQLSNIADTLKDVQRNLGKLEDRMEDNFMEVWKELGSKSDKIKN